MTAPSATARAASAGAIDVLASSAWCSVEAKRVNRSFAACFVAVAAARRIFSASVYTTLGIASDLFTPIFAMSRITGWTAHLFEQYANNRLIRPKAEYTGPRGLKVTPLEAR